jgi:hypothetical protein
MKNNYKLMYLSGKEINESNYLSKSLLGKMNSKKSDDFKKSYNPNKKLNKRRV